MKRGEQSRKKLKAHDKGKLERKSGKRKGDERVKVRKERDQKKEKSGTSRPTIG